MSKLSEKQKELIWLLVIILVGAFLRFYKLDFQSLGNDELSSWNLSKNASGVSDVVKIQAEHDVNPPGFQIILFYVIHYLGDNEFWLRLPSAAAGILSVYMMYLIGLKLFSAKEGLIAAALTAISWCPIYYSQEARSYSFLLLFSIITVFFWANLTIKPASASFKTYCSIGAYALSAIITISLHYFGMLLVFLAAAGMLFYLLIEKKPLRNFFIAHGIIFLTFLPFIPPLLIDFNPSFKTFIKTPTPFYFVKVFLFFFNNSYWFLFLALGLYFFLLIKIIYERKYRYSISSEFNLPRLVLISWLIAPFIISYLVSVIFLPVLTERNLIISLPAAYLLISHSIVQLPFNLLFKRLFLILLILISLFHLVVKNGYYTKPAKPQFREAAEYILKKEQNILPPFIIGYSWSEYKFNYYFERKGSHYHIDALLGGKNDIQSLQNLIKENELDYFWYLFAHRTPDNEFLEFLGKTYHIKEEKKLFGAGVMRCETK